ncbi:hypothetical protein ACHAWC_004956, partial [Mediolabrus comicus]
GSNFACFVLGQEGDLWAFRGQPAIPAGYVIGFAKTALLISFSKLPSKYETCQRVRFRRNGEWRLRWNFGQGLCIPDDRCLPFNIVVGSVGNPGCTLWNARYERFRQKCCR